MEAELFSAIVESSPSGVAVLVGEELRFALANPAYCFAVFGWDTAPLGARLEEVLHGEALDRKRDVLRRVLATGEPAQVARDTRQLGDRTRTFSYHARRIDWSGQHGVLVVLWDTTELEEERARAERASYEAWALQRITDPLLVEGGSEPFLQTLVDKVREVMKAHAGSIFLLEPGGQGLVLRTSSGLSLGESKGLRLAMGENLVGRAAAEGRTLWLADAQAVPSVWTSYIRAQNIRGILATPMRVADKLIGVVHVDYQHAHEFSPAEVHLLEVMASRAAIATHQAQLLADNQHQRDRLATLIDTAPVGIVAYGADGRPETVNAAAEIIAGQPPDWGLRIEDEPGHYGIRRKDGSPLPAPEHPAMQAMQGKRCERVPLVIQQRSGRRVHVEVSAAPLRDAASRTVGAVMILEDVSALHDQEHLREEFLIAAAHELKTPLTIAKGCASLLADHVDTGGRTLVERLHRACTRMDHRTDEMLEAVALKSAPHSPPRVDPLR